MADLHPDVVQAIQQLSHTKLGRRYNRFAKKRYGVRGAVLAGKTVSGEFGGRRTKGNRGIVSSAGARGPAQFIPSTREAYIKQYGVDPWKNDKQAIKGLMLHQLNTGVEGYNPGMPTYKNYILGQKLNAEDLAALRGAGGGGSGRTPGGVEVSTQSRKIPGQSFAAERQAARRQLLLGDINLSSLLEYKQTVNSLADVPDREVREFSVKRTKGKKSSVKLKDAPAGTVHEVFYDPLGEYWDSGKIAKGAIGGHSDHVHVSADPDEVVRLGRLAKSLGLNVSGQDKFGGRPTSGHVQGSFHYKGLAIDVSGDPAVMRKFARVALGEARRGRRRGR